MPVIKSAKKKLKKDKGRTQRNKIISDNLKKAIKSAKKTPSEKTVKEAVIRIDKSVKNKLMHKNKAARIKSKLSKLIKKTGTKTTPAKSKVTPKNKAKSA